MHNMRPDPAQNQGFCQFLGQIWLAFPTSLIYIIPDLKGPDWAFDLLLL